jgi:cation:H+ antiporter
VRRREGGVRLGNHDMLIQFFWVGIGLVLLVAGADALVRGASRLALSFGVSPLVVGLTVVAFGTSAPEMAVSVGAARSGSVDIAIGNVVGSNIFNVLFILGAAALIAPLVVNAQLIRQEVPVMIAASMLLILLCADGGISRVDGTVLFALLLAYTVFLVVQSRRQTSATRAEYAEAVGESVPGEAGSRRSASVGYVIGGLALLVLGAQTLVGAAVTIAALLGVPELIVGLTIVAAGTSLPEVATSIMATIRGERDIAVGNVVGSNTFNILGVLGVSALVAPSDLPVARSVLAFDLPVMTVVAVACLPVFFTGRTIARWEGTVFLGYYVAYTAYLVLAMQRHEATEAFSDAMLWFVLPITLLTLVVSLAGELKARRS